MNSSDSESNLRCTGSFHESETSIMAVYSGSTSAGMPESNPGSTDGIEELMMDLLLESGEVLSESDLDVIDLAREANEETKTKLLVFHTTPTGRRVARDPIIIHVDRSVLEKHSPPWESTFKHENPLRGTWPLDDERGFEIEQENVEAFINVMAVCHGQWDIVRQRISLQELFDITIITERQALWGAIKPYAFFWLEECAFYNASGNAGTKQYFVDNPHKWLVISFLWGLPSIFYLVFGPAASRSDLSTFHWCPKDDMQTSADTAVYLASSDCYKVRMLRGTSHFDSQLSDRKMLTTSPDVIWYRRTGRLTLLFQILSGAMKQLEHPTRPRSGGHHFENHNRAEYKARLLRFLRRDCRLLEHMAVFGGASIMAYPHSPETLALELEAVALGLDHADDISNKFCNRLQAGVAREKRDLHAFWPPSRQMRNLLMMGTMSSGLDLVKVLWIEKRVQNIMDEDRQRTI